MSGNEGMEDRTPYESVIVVWALKPEGWDIFLHLGREKGIMIPPITLFSNDISNVSYFVNTLFFLA